MASWLEPVGDVAENADVSDCSDEGSEERHCSRAAALEAQVGSCRTKPVATGTLAMTCQAGVYDDSDAAYEVHVMDEYALDVGRVLVARNDRGALIPTHWESRVICKSFHSGRSFNSAVDDVRVGDPSRGADHAPVNARAAAALEENAAEGAALAATAAADRIDEDARKATRVRASKGPEGIDRPAPANQLHDAGAPNDATATLVVGEAPYDTAFQADAIELEVALASVERRLGIFHDQVLRICTCTCDVVSQQAE